MPAFKEPTAGELRHHVTIQQIGPQVSDGMGGYTMSWVDVVSLWARFEVWKGKEVLTANMAASSVYWEVTTRYRPNIHNEMRILEKDTGIWYNIRYLADPTKKKQWLTYSVEAVRQP